MCSAAKKHKKEAQIIKKKLCVLSNFDSVPEKSLKIFMLHMREHRNHLHKLQYINFRFSHFFPGST